MTRSESHLTHPIGAAAVHLDRVLTRPELVRRLAQIRRRHPLLRRRSFFQGRSIVGRDIKDIVWLNPDGHEMSDEEWGQSFVRCLGMYLAGRALEPLIGRACIAAVADPEKIQRHD